MANYLEMTREELMEEERRLQKAYKAFQDLDLHLNMARGKPGPHQMDLAMDLSRPPITPRKTAPTPATTATWRACTRPGNCLAT